MKQRLLVAAMMICFWLQAEARAAADKETFELTPAAPPTPVLKYHLLFDPVEQTPGNAAPLYLRAEAAMPHDLRDQLDSFDSHNYTNAQFPEAADALFQQTQPVFDNLNLAGRCEQCDWKTPLREEGVAARLPYLNDIRTLTRLLCIRAHEMRLAGNMPEAVATLRLVYEISRKTAEEPLLIGGLVGVGTMKLANDELAALMNRPDAPNLYWALASLPGPILRFPHSLSGEKFIIPRTIKQIDGADLDDFSGDDLRPVFKRAIEQIRVFSSKDNPVVRIWDNDQALADAVEHNLPEAQRYYIRTRNVTDDQAQSMEPFKLAAIYWYETACNLRDEAYAASSLPYPLMIRRMDILTAEEVRIRRDQPANLFMEFVGTYERAAETFCRLDRQIAALTDVEAIRSYAAANSGTLPDHLQDITDTPALDNPRTGKPFNYQVSNGMAILSDLQLDNDSLEFTIRIRK